MSAVLVGCYYFFCQASLLAEKIYDICTLIDTQNRYMRGLYTILLLVVSNIFMTLAWYGNLKLSQMHVIDNWPLILIILASWGLAMFEYMFMIPANRLGSELTGGPFSLMQLKVIQECVTLTVFTLITVFVFKTESFRLNHLIGFGFMVLAVYFMFKK